MAIAFVKGGDGSGVASGTATTSSIGTTTTGNLMVVCCASNSATSNDFSSVTDNKSNTYTRAKSQPGNATDVEIWYAANITGGASHTVTATTTNGFRNVALVAQEYSGAATTTPLDQTAGATGTSATPSSGATATTTQADEMVFGALVVEASDAISLGSGFSNLGTNTGIASLRPAAESMIISSTGAQTATFGIAASQPWNCAVATFKATGGGGGGNPGRSTMAMMGVG